MELDKTTSVEIEFYITTLFYYISQIFCHTMEELQSFQWLLAGVKFLEAFGSRCLFYWQVCAHDGCYTWKTDGPVEQETCDVRHLPV